MLIGGFSGAFPICAWAKDGLAVQIKSAIQPEEMASAFFFVLISYSIIVKDMDVLAFSLLCCILIQAPMEMQC